MSDPDYGAPVFGLLSDFEEREADLKRKIKAEQREKSRYKRHGEEREAALGAQIEQLEEEDARLREVLDQSETLRRHYERRCSDLQAEITKRDKDKRDERQKLAEWIDRRLAQQEEALSVRYVSKETKRMVEIEVSLLKRYRDYVIKSADTKGQDDPFMPRFY